MPRTDPNHGAEAREACAKALAEALAVALAGYRFLPAALLPSPWLERIARRQIEALRGLPEPTLRAALMGEAP